MVLKEEITLDHGQQYELSFTRVLLASYAGHEIKYPSWHLMVLQSMPYIRVHCIQHTYNVIKLWFGVLGLLDGSCVLQKWLRIMKTVL
jgi:hypothetical protein